MRQRSEISGLECLSTAPAPTAIAVLFLLVATEESPGPVATAGPVTTARRWPRMSGIVWSPWSPAPTSPSRCKPGSSVFRTARFCGVHPFTRMARGNTPTPTASRWRLATASVTTGTGRCSSIISKWTPSCRKWFLSMISGSTRCFRPSPAGRPPPTRLTRLPTPSAGLGTPIGIRLVVHCQPTSTVIASTRSRKARAPSAPFQRQTRPPDGPSRPIRWISFAEAMPRR